MDKFRLTLLTGACVRKNQLNWDGHWPPVYRIRITVDNKAGVLKQGMPVDADYSACDFLTNTGEPFDGVKTFIVCRPGGRVQVLYHPIEGVLGSATCSATTFCETAEAFVGWFDDQVRATAPPFFPINPFADKDAGSA
jgi:hypothetical protein